MANAKLFNEQNRIHCDTCAINAKNTQNEAINNYNIYNYFKGNTTQCDTFDKSAIINLSADTQMHIKDGYGVANECEIDTDSTLRNKGVWTNTREKTQLYTRVFQGIPNINNGGLIVPVEDRVKQGEFKSLRKGCDGITEREFPVFTPLIPCLSENVQNVKHIIPDYKQNLPTRDFIHQKSFLEANGYVLDGKVWKKKYCTPDASFAAST